MAKKASPPPPAEGRRVEEWARLRQALELAAHDPALREQIAGAEAVSTWRCEAEDLAWGISIAGGGVQFLETPSEQARISFSFRSWRDLEDDLLGRTSSAADHEVQRRFRYRGNHRLVKYFGPLYYALQRAYRELASAAATPPAPDSRLTGQATDKGARPGGRKPSPPR
ncbi:MAG: hypothetical protein EXR60_01435 [Dehalococcoidia bacterium]|nr:hypothetical protein [Dehalococcoidia bacterium]